MYIGCKLINYTYNYNEIIDATKNNSGARRHCGDMIK